MHVFSFGAIADIHHADADDRVIPGTKIRYYRNGKNALNRALSGWKKQDVKYICQLGDILDEKNVFAGKQWQAIEEMMDQFKTTNCPVYHVVGNHELYNFSHSELSAIIADNNEEGNETVSYYSVEISEDIQLIAVNCFDVSVLGYERTHPKYIQAHDLLNIKNKNADKGLSHGLQGLAKRFVDFNGSLGAVQMEWLNRELNRAEEDHKKVILIGHVPIFPGATPNNIDIVWNYEEVLRVIHQYSCVKLYIAGHTHEPGFAFDAKGVCHMTLTGVIETTPGVQAHYTFHDDRIMVKEPTHGCMMTIPFVGYSS